MFSIMLISLEIRPEFLFQPIHELVRQTFPQDILINRQSAEAELSISIVCESNPDNFFF